MPKTNESTPPGDGPRLLAGGNPQIPKGDGDAPVQAYIDAMPGWKSDVGRHLDALIEQAVPDAPRPTTCGWRASRPWPRRSRVRLGPTVANLYDIEPDGTATVVSRGTRLVREGTGNVSFELYGQDWVLPAGHRIGVRITDANSDWWTHLGTHAPVTVTEATVTLPFLTYQRSQFLDGGSTPRLEQHLASQTVTLSDDLIASSQTDFSLPRPLTEPPDGDDGSPPGRPADPGCSNRPAAARGGPGRCV